MHYTGTSLEKSLWLLSFEFIKEHLEGGCFLCANVEMYLDHVIQGPSPPPPTPPPPPLTINL